MDVQYELRQLGREKALGDLELTEAKIVKLGKLRCTPDEHQFDLGGEA